MRAKWTSAIGATFAIAGGAVGIGSMLLFPIKMYAYMNRPFFWYYALFLLAFGLPLAIAETILGVLSKKSSIDAFKKFSKPGELISFGGIPAYLLQMALFTVYSVLSSYYFVYILLALVGSISTSDPQILHNTVSRSPFFIIGGSLMVIALTAFVVYWGIRQGIERCSRLLFPILFFLILMMFGVVTSFDEFSSICKKILLPGDFTFYPKMMLEALGLALLSLCAGTGGLITYGSYMACEDNIAKITLKVTVILLAIALLSSLTLCSVAQHVHLTSTFSEAFVFTALLYLLKTLPWTDLKAFLFFTTFGVAIITSTVSMLEVLVSNSIEQFGLHRKKAVIVIASSIAIAASIVGGSHVSDFIGVDLVKILVLFVSDIFIALTALLSVALVGWKIDKGLLKPFFAKKYQYGIWLFMLRIATPSAIVLFFASYLLK